jgi:uncharacterized membrane protein
MQDSPGWSDEQVDQMIGNLLRAGVILSATLVLIGGVIYLARHGHETADHRTFHGEPDEFRSVFGIVSAVVSGRGRAIVQLGLLALIATPVVRVALSAFAFFRQRDWTYTAMTLFVLGVLLYSLFVGDP